MGVGVWGAGAMKPWGQLWEAVGVGGWSNVGHWGHEAMGPEGHGGEVQQVGMHGPKTQLDYGEGWGHGPGGRPWAARAMKP